DFTPSCWPNSSRPAPRPPLYSNKPGAPPAAASVNFSPRRTGKWRRISRRNSAPSSKKWKSAIVDGRSTGADFTIGRPRLRRNNRRSRHGSGGIRAVVSQVFGRRQRGCPPMILHDLSSDRDAENQEDQEHHKEQEEQELCDT